jgi:hypothetical protein
MPHPCDGAFCLSKSTGVEREMGRKNGSSSVEEGSEQSERSLVGAASKKYLPKGEVFLIARHLLTLRSDRGRSRRRRDGRGWFGSCGWLYRRSSRGLHRRGDSRCWLWLTVGTFCPINTPLINGP